MIDSITTGEFGRFSFTQAFPDPGPHWVEVELKVQDYLLDNKARIDLEVTLPTVTTVEAPVSVEVGEEFSVSGTLHGARGEPLAGQPVSVRIDGLPLQQVSTDDAGVFELHGHARRTRRRHGARGVHRRRPRASLSRRQRGWPCGRWRS